MGTLKVDSIEPGQSGSLSFSGTIDGSTIDQLDASHITTGRLNSDRFQVVTDYVNTARTQLIHSISGSWVNRIDISFNNFSPLVNNVGEYVFISGFNSARGSLPDGDHTAFTGETNNIIQESLTPLVATLGQTTSTHCFPATVEGNFGQAVCSGVTTIDIIRDYTVDNVNVFQGCAYSTQARFINNSNSPTLVNPNYYSIIGRDLYGANENDPIDRLLFRIISPNSSAQFQGGFSITEMA